MEVQIGPAQPFDLPRLRALLVARDFDRFRVGSAAGLVLRAGKGLPQAFDRLRQPCDLLRQLLGIALLRGDQAADRLQLVLHHLELIDRFLLGRFEALGLLDQLLGGLRGAGLQLAGATARSVSGELPV